MEIKIIEEKNNILFGRKEIVAEVESKYVPNYLEIEKLISEKYSVPAENIKIKKIQGHFGYNAFKIIALIYKSKEEKDKIERVKKIKSASVPAR